METLNVILKLNEIICHDEGDGWGSAEPYLWVIFFKIDGLSVWQNGTMLGGEADFKFSRGSHNNLPNHDVDSGEVVEIPASVGEWSTILKPIEITDFQGNITEVSGIIGVVAVLMEEDNVSDDGAEAGHQGLNNYVKDSINNFISSINLWDFVNSDDPAEDVQQKIDDLIRLIKDNIKSVVKDAIKSNQNLLENLWAWIDKDDKIGDVIWTYNATEIMSNSYNIALNKRWRKEGGWEINGEISASELCPANAVNSLSVKELNKNLDLPKLRTFRNTLYKEFPLAANWWNIVLKNSPFIMQELQKNKNLCNDVFQIIKNIEASVDGKDRFNESFFDDISIVLEKLGKSKFKSLRMDSRRLKPIIKELRGKNLNEVLDHLSSNKPLVRVK